MKYLVLRDCFTEECRYFRKGDTVELPDEMYKYEKNFRAVDAPAEVDKTDTNEVGATGVVTEPQRELNPGEYLCSKCSAIHRDSSRVGKAHLKYKG